MAAQVEATLKISAQDRTAKAFAAIESRFRKAEQSAERASRKQQRMAAIERAQMRATAGGSHGGKPGSTMFLGGGALAGGAAAYLTGGVVRAAITDYAALERQMTRIGLAAGATVEETRGATREVAGFANDFALPLDEAVSGLDALVATGMDMREAMAFLPSILRTSQASGAATDEMAQSANSLATSFKVTGQEMQRAFDMLVTGGQLGMFELKDMAQYLPSLTASAAKLGFVGLDGTKKLVAMLQTVRQVSGTSGEAATAVADAIEKTLSPTVAKAFKERGIDIGRVLETAAKKGQNQFEAVIDVLDDMTRGMSDTQRNMLISSIYTDKEARRAVVAMLTLRDAYRGYESAIEDSAGATDKNLKRVLEDMQATLDRTSNAWENFRNSMVRAFDAAGGSTLLQGVADVVNTELNRIQDPSLEAKYQSDQKVEQSRFRRDGLNQSILDTERTVTEAKANRDSGIFPYVPGEAEKSQAALDQILMERAKFEAGVLWGAQDRGFPVAPPLWLQQTTSSPVPSIGAAARPMPDPRRGQMMPSAADLFDSSAAPPGYPTMNRPAAASAPTTGRGANWLPAPSPAEGLALAGASGAADDLRQAMEDGGGEISKAGTDAATAINTAADNLRQAARDAAATLSSVRIPMPTPRPAINANTGQSMPNAGLPGAN